MNALPGVEGVRGSDFSIRAIALAFLVCIGRVIVAGGLLAEDIVCSAGTAPRRQQERPTKRTAMDEQPLKRSDSGVFHMISQEYVGSV